MKPNVQVRGAVQIVEESVALLRIAPAEAIFTYLFGAAPFLVAFLYFLSEMMRSPFAHERLAMESLIVAALFVWKRIWQAVFAAQLHKLLSGRGFSRRFLFRTIVLQAALQPLRLIALPVTFFATVPFAWSVAFFRNVGLFSAVGDPNPVQTARSQASLWTPQNWGVLGLLTGAGFLLALNLLIALVMLPGMIRSFLGIEGDLARMGSMVLNLTTVTIALSIAWLAIDPILGGSSCVALLLRSFSSIGRRSEGCPSQSGCDCGVARDLARLHPRSRFGTECGAAQPGIAEPDYRPCPAGAFDG